MYIIAIAAASMCLGCLVVLKIRTTTTTTDSQDARNLLNYRGISLLSVPYKIYADILNQRLMKWLDENRLLVEQQNSFRKKRNCIEHIIYSLYTIINNRKLSRHSTFACFIDYKKAFDTVNRDMLWYKLMCIGVNERIIIICKRAMYR